MQNFVVGYLCPSSWMGSNVFRNKGLNIISKNKSLVRGCQYFRKCSTYIFRVPSWATYSRWQHGVVSISESVVPTFLGSLLGPHTADGSKGLSAFQKV